MTKEELREISYKKIETALSEELPAHLTAQFILAFALLENKPIQVQTAAAIEEKVIKV